MRRPSTANQARSKRHGAILTQAGTLPTMNFRDRRLDLSWQRVRFLRDFEAAEPFWVAPPHSVWQRTQKK